MFASNTEYSPVCHGKDFDDSWVSATVPKAWESTQYKFSYKKTKGVLHQQ